MSREQTSDDLRAGACALHPWNRLPRARIKVQAFAREAKRTRAGLRTDFLAACTNEPERREAERTELAAALPERTRARRHPNEPEPRTIQTDPGVMRSKRLTPPFRSVAALWISQP
jgi:hypothetical protein